MKMAVFWVVTDGDSKHLWNVGKFLSDYIAQQPRRQSSSKVNNDLFLDFVKRKDFPSLILGCNS
jgi:hypothetical protein